MDTVTVVGNAPFPDIPEGRAVTVDRTPRVDGLLASGRIRLVAEPVPGTVTAVKAWVGRDLDRALQALAVENLRPSGPRTTLAGWLEALTSPPQAPYGDATVPTFDHTDGPPEPGTDAFTGP